MAADVRPSLLVDCGLSAPFLVTCQDDAFRDEVAGFLGGRPAVGLPGGFDLAGRIEVTAEPSLERTGSSASIQLTAEPEAILVEGPGFLGVVPVDPSAWPARLHLCFRDPAEATSALLHVLRVACAVRALASGGALVHSAALVAGGRALLFHGPSGIGKSTLARLGVGLGARCLSDDLNVISQADDGPLARALPNAGSMGPPIGEIREARLAGIFRLERGLRHEVEPLSPAQAVASLLSNLAYVGRHPACQGRALGVLGRFVREVPAFRLRFRPDAGFWPLVREAVR